MMPNPTNTVSLLMNTFFTDTVPSGGPANPLEASSTQVPISRELLDMPNVIPDLEAGDDYAYWDDVAG